MFGNIVLAFFYVEGRSRNALCSFYGSKICLYTFALNFLIIFNGVFRRKFLQEMMANFMPAGSDPQQAMAAFMAPPRFKAEDPDRQGDNEVLFARALDAAKDADVVIAGS